MSLLFNDPDVMGFMSSILFNTAALQIRGTDHVFPAKPFFFLLLRDLIRINFWWGIINLLPVMPLDGGLSPSSSVPSAWFFWSVPRGCHGGARIFLDGFPLHGDLLRVPPWRNYQNMQAVRWQ